MCGVFGFISAPESHFDTRRFGSLVRSLFILSESRGKDASGLALLNDSELTILKRPLRARQLLRDPEYRAALHGFQSRVRRPGEALGFLGHARMVTNGSEETHENNQPIIGEELCLLHNGIIVNDAELWDEFPTLSRHHEVDTEVALQLTRHYRSTGKDLGEAFRDAYSHLIGANSFAMMATDADVLILATSNGSLYFAVSPARTELIFASEKYFLEKARTHPSITLLFGDAPIHHVAPGEGFVFGLSELTPCRFMPNGGTHAERGADARSEAPRLIRDIRPAPETRSPAPAHLSSTQLSVNDRFIQKVNEAVKGLRRCTRCVLPETFPSIEFDGEGVCNYCRNYEPLHFHGYEALEDRVRPFRRTDGRPDCLVPISGGRDSCYGLHFIKNELGMNPVAFTYDWGMVTDLARRNISRMCGALGVEHILLSADIKTKRKYIRQNVLAWLKHPVLGTVPLFMAGDKPFWYYAQLLRRQMGIDLLMFSFNWLERTEFKTAFADVARLQETSQYMTKLNLLQLAGYYAKEYLKNPAYLNSSLPDTVFAFFSFYLVPRQYETIYDYVHWDETAINNVLIDRYDWEAAGDARGTWRIGDGTASFYNYIYYTMAGFTENDTFRSNQIREGVLAREQALQFIEDENQPRYATIQWYCDTIGIDMDGTLKTINETPKLYPGLQRDDVARR